MNVTKGLVAHAAYISNAACQVVLPAALDKLPAASHVADKWDR